MKRGDMRMFEILENVQRQGYDSIDDYCNQNGLDYTDLFDDPDSHRYNEEVDGDDKW